MNCPNDRYVNDAAICQAVAANLARIGVKVNLQTETKVTLLPEDPAPRHRLLPAGLDAQHLRRAQRAVRPDGHARTTRGRASSTWAAYSNPKLDELTLKIQSETDAGQAQRR